LFHACRASIALKPSQFVRGISKSAGNELPRKRSIEIEAIAKVIVT
jgi:hypothetical protein